MFSLTPRRSERSLSPWLSFQDEMENFFDRFSRDLGTFETSYDFVPRVDVKDKGESYEVCAEVPGMTEKEISISLRENNLILEGERKKELRKEGRDYLRNEISYGSFYRSIPFASDVDPDKVNASYKDGILTVTLEKLPGSQNKARRIPISTGASAQKH
jgi:HSP20 family protein